jgi:YVTN family beta-propeller protein
LPRTRLFPLLVLTLFVSSCASQSSTTHPAPGYGENQLLLYLQPLPQESSRIRFTIDRISAIPFEGEEVPLTLSFTEVKGAEMRTQKLFASGPVTPGQDKGFSVSIKEAFLSGTEGEAAMIVPAEPVTVACAFSVSRGVTVTVFLSLSPTRLVSEGVRFSPVFSLQEESRVLTTLTAYVTNSDSNAISVFDKKSMRIFGTIATGNGPRGVVLDQTRRRGYTAIADEDSIQVIDVSLGKITEKILLKQGDRPVELALAPDGRTLVCANYRSNTVSVVDALSKFEIRRVNVGNGPCSVTIDRPGGKAYVMNSLSNTVSVVDIQLGKLAGTISVEPGPSRGVFNRSGSRFYVISRDSPNLNVIDSATLSVTERIFIGPGTLSLAIDPRTDLIYAGKGSGGEIAVIDPSSSMFVDTMTIGNQAAFILIDRELNALFVLDSEARTLRKVNLVSKKIMGEIEVGQGPFAVAVMGER